MISVIALQDVDIHFAALTKGVLQTHETDTAVSDFVADLIQGMATLSQLEIYFRELGDCILYYYNIKIALNILIAIY